MAVVAFWSDEEKETGQTMSMVALSTYMAIEHNYRILNISANFRETTLENSYWDSSKEEDIIKAISTDMVEQGKLRKNSLESTVESLARIINSNKTSNSIVSSYSKVVFKDRLDVLCATKTKKYDEYKDIVSLYPEIIKAANRDYDLVFIDVSKKMETEDAQKILDAADIIVVNITQRLKNIDGITKLKEEGRIFSKNNVLINIGRYDKFSKYNIKNIERYLKEKNINCIPYNTLFFEACSEGKVAELFLRLRKLDEEDRNYLFINEIKEFSNNLIYKLKMLQIRI